MPKPRPALFKWRQFEPEIIVCAVRWYLRFSLSYRDVDELLMELVCLLTTPPFGAGCSATLQRLEAVAADVPVWRDGAC
jgi:hypothetical protein